MAWGLSPGWTQASQGHVAGHVSLMPGSPRQPCLLQSTGPRAGASRTLALCTPALTLPRGLREFSTAPVFSLVSPRFSGLRRTTLIPALSAAGGEAPAALHPTCQLTAQARPSDGSQVPPLTPQGPHCLLCPLFLEPWGSAGPLPNLGPSSGQSQSVGHYAKAAQEAPWVARWALTGPPQDPHLRAMTPKEQN